LQKNGYRIPVEVSNHLFELKGKPTVISAVKDITSRKQAEEAQKHIEQAVRESEHRFRTLAEASFEGIALTENGIIVDMNEQLAHMYEYERSELIGKSLFDIVVPELRAHVNETIQLGKRESYEILGLRKNGTTFPAEVRGRITRMGGKELYISTIRDITERKQTEKIFQHERNLLRTLIDTMPELINYKDLEGRYLLNNLAHLRSIGAKCQEDALGKTMFDFHAAELAQQYYDNEMQVIQSGKAIIETEELALHKDTGEKRWHLSSKVPLKDNQGKAASYSTISRDITERKHAEADRERLIKELQSAGSDIKTLSGLVPICANCKKIRDDKGFWTQVESYIQERSHARFSHGICPDCMKKLYPNFILNKGTE